MFETIAIGPSQMFVHPLAIVQSLVAISAANGAPLLCKWLLGARLARAIDGGLILRDGYPLLGSSKTWRGLIAAIILSTCASIIVGLPRQAGALAGAFAMAGDCLSSFAKRRLGLGPGDMCPGLDQNSRVPSAHRGLQPIPAARLVRRRCDRRTFLCRPGRPITSFFRDRSARPALLTTRFAPVGAA